MSRCSPIAEDLVTENGLTLSRPVRVLALAASPLRNVRAAFRRSDPSRILRSSTVTALFAGSLLMSACLKSFCGAAVKVATVKLVREAAKVTRGISGAVEGLATFCQRQAKGQT